MAVAVRESGDGPGSKALKATVSQLASERRVVRFTRGQPFARFERIPGRRAEALDCVVYSIAARALVGVAVERRAEEVASVTMAPKRATVTRSKWLGR